MNLQTRRLAPKSLTTKRVNSGSFSAASSTQKYKGLKLSISSHGTAPVHKIQAPFADFFECNNICGLNVEESNEIDGDLWAAHFQQGSSDPCQKSSEFLSRDQKTHEKCQDSSSNSTVGTCAFQTPSTPINKLCNIDELLKESSIKSKGIMLISSTCPQAQRRPSGISTNNKMAHSMTRLVTNPKNIFKPLEKQSKYTPITSACIRFSQQPREKMFS